MSVTHYILFSQLPPGAEFMFFIAEMPVRAMKLNDEAWIPKPLEVITVSKEIYSKLAKDIGEVKEWLSPIEDKWVVQSL